jgi:hypothetical protein
MFKRKSNVFLLWLVVNISVLLLVFIHAHLRERNDAPFLKERMRIVEKYGLTDLCLFTDAQYTRNPAMTDVATPFQDHPTSMEHFPSGSIIPPSPHLMRRTPGKL